MAFPPTFPTHADRLTADWLTGALRAAAALGCARVTSVATAPLDHEKGLTGQLVRLLLTYDREEAGAPRTLVAKFSSPDPRIRALFLANGSYEREVRFYRELAPRSPLRTPRCYFGDLDAAEGWSLLLLEELTAVRNGDTIAGCSLAEAELAVGALATFHAAWWQHPALARHDWLRPRGVLAVADVPAIFARTWGPFLGKLGPRATDEIRQIGLWLERSLGWLTTHIYEGDARTLIHNDYQADNLFFAGTGADLALTAFDWQVASRGRGAYDLAYFLGGSLDSDLRRRHELDLLRRYHAGLLARGVTGYPFARCLDDYRLAMLQRLSRLVTVLGLGAVPPGRERAFCEVLVPRYCRAIHDLGVGELLPGAP